MCSGKSSKATSRKTNHSICRSPVWECTTLGINDVFLPSLSFQFLGNWDLPLQTGTCYSSLFWSVDVLMFNLSLVLVSFY